MRLIVDNLQYIYGPLIYVKWMSLADNRLARKSPIIRFYQLISDYRLIPNVHELCTLTDRVVFFCCVNGPEWCHFDQYGTSLVCESACVPSPLRNQLIVSRASTILSCYRQDGKVAKIPFIIYQNSLFTWYPVSSYFLPLGKILRNSHINIQFQKGRIALPLKHA